MTAAQSEHLTRTDTTESIGNAFPEVDNMSQPSASDIESIDALPSDDSIEPSTFGPEDREALRTLSLLTPIEYDRVRKSKAKGLGIRESTLDAEVEALRRNRIQQTTTNGFDEVEPWSDEVDGASLLDDVAKTVRSFVVCDTETADGVALWVAFSWAIAAVDVAPIAMITAPEKRCGKTRLLELIGSLVPCPCPASSITAAALFRAIELWRPTLLIDEADTFLGDKDDLRGVLNSGHTRSTAFVIRCTGDDHQPQRFTTWGAKAIAAIGSLPDTLTDRSIPLRLRRKLTSEQVKPMREGKKLFRELSEKLARWRDDSLDKIVDAQPDLPEGLHDRAQDNWLPLLKIAQVAGGPWPERARMAALFLSGSYDETSSLGTELLRDVRDLFDGNPRERVFTADLVRELVRDPELRWATYANGRALTDRQLSRLLKTFGVQSGQIRIGSESKKGYLRADFEDAFQRYLRPASPKQGNTYG